MQQKNIKPLGARIVVKQEEATLSKGGILLPGSAQKKPRCGEVLAVGPGRFDEEGNHIVVDVKVGDRVLFSSYGGTEYKSEEVQYLILSEDDVLATIN